MGSLSINLLGTNFKINAHKDDKYLQQLLDYYTDVINKLQESVQSKDSLQIAILAGILISDELYTQKYCTSNAYISEDDSSALLQLETLTHKILKHIDKVL